MLTNDKLLINDRRLLIQIIFLGAGFVLLAILIGRHWAHTGTFGTLEIVLSFVMGLLLHLLATWLYHLLFGSDIPGTLQEQIRSIELTCDAVYRGGLWVEGERLRLDKHYYDGLINIAEQVTVLGIANKSFMTNLVRDFPENPDNGEDFDLDYVMNQPLFQRLRLTETLPSLRVTVIFLSPNSAAAARRAAEEQNSETVRHLNKLLMTIRNLQSAYEKDKEAFKNKAKSSKTRLERWNLKGYLEFRALDDIPENSISLFQDVDDSDRTVMVVGLLPKDLSGEKCPSIIIHRNREHMRILDSFEEKLKQVRNKSSLVLEWDYNGPRLQPDWKKDPAP